MQRKESSRAGLLAVLVLAFVPGWGVAGDADVDSPDTSPAGRILAERDLARARFDLSRADVKDLARRRIEAARQAVRAREQEFLAGRGTLDILLEMQTRLAQAQEPLPERVTANREALERLWRGRWVACNVARAGYQAGRVKAADYYQTLDFLLEVEIQLALSRPGKK